MKLKIKKRDNGDAVMTFVRDDGSATSGRLGAGGFGAVHDLTHYVVESTLGLRAGFFGLLAQGWNIPDFEVKSAARQLPDESIVAECIVGQLTNAVIGGHEPSADEFNWLVAAAVAGVRPGVHAPAVSAEVLQRMNRQLGGLLAQWRALPPGGAIALEFSLA